MNQSPDRLSEIFQWYAVTTRSRHEKKASIMLSAIGIPFFLPLQSEVRQWSDRKQFVSFPLFPGYIFVNMNPLSQGTLEVLKTPGITGFVGNRSGPSPISDGEIKNIRTLVDQGVECNLHSCVEQGDRVRVARGVLAGIEGTLLRKGSKTQLILSVETIQRSVSVTVSEDDVEIIAPPVKPYSHIYAADSSNL